MNVFFLYQCIKGHDIVRSLKNTFHFYLNRGNILNVILHLDKEGKIMLFLIKFLYLIMYEFTLLITLYYTDLFFKQYIINNDRDILKVLNQLNEIS